MPSVELHKPLTATRPYSSNNSVLQLQSLVHRKQADKLTKRTVAYETTIDDAVWTAGATTINQSNNSSRLTHHQNKVTKKQHILHPQDQNNIFYRKNLGHIFDKANETARTSDNKHSNFNYYKDDLEFIEPSSNELHPQNITFRASNIL